LAVLKINNFWKAPSLWNTLAHYVLCGQYTCIPLTEISGFQPGGRLPFFQGSRELMIKCLSFLLYCIFRIWNHFLS